MAYPKTIWQDSQNKYDIQKQDGTVIESDIKLVYKGTGGTPISAANMQKIEDELEKQDTQMADLVHLVQEIVVVDSNVTSITFDNLDGDYNDGYILVGEIIQGIQNNVYCELYANNDLEKTNYVSTRQLSTSASYQYPAVAITSQNESAVFTADILCDSSGVFRASSICNRGTSSMPAGWIFSVQKQSAITNIARLDLMASVANGIGIGSRFRLYRRGHK